MGLWRSALGLFLVGVIYACGGFAARGQEVPQAPGGEHRARPQEPKPPFPYLEEEVTYRNPNASGVELAGAFTAPRKETASPAVLLITGAGPQDRDDTIAGHKFFLVLADYLTRHDIAVLRVDRRGVGQSTGDFKYATTKDFASDAEAGVRYLMKRKEVDQRHIGLIGHGEGAIIAAMVASRMTQQIAFAVLLNGTAVSGDKVLLAQTARAEAAAGVPDEQIDADLRIGSGIYRLVEQGRSVAEIDQALSNVPENYKPFVEPWKRQVPKLDSPWLHYFLLYNPTSALEEVKCPVLALFGEKDMTIDPEQNASAMKTAFSHARNREAKVKILPELNYLFQKANTGLGREYESIPETISPVALETIQAWIAKQVQ